MYFFEAKTLITTYLNFKFSIDKNQNFKISHGKILYFERYE